MKEKRKNENAALIYAIVGVTVLIVAIVGSTFAFFSASETAANKIVGTAASVGLELTLSDETTNATGNLIPIDETDLSKGAVGYESNGKCIDKNGNTVCKIYKVTVKNTSTATALLSGSVNITPDSGSTFKNLKWNKMTNITTPGTGYPITTTALTTKESFTAGQTKDYYIMVYINNIDSNQSSEDTGSFTGTVTFNSASGSEVKANFGDDSQPLIQYISNLYTNANKTEVTNNGITYNYATSVSLMNDRLGNSNVPADNGNIRYYGANPNNYIDIGDVYTEDTVIDNFEKNRIYFFTNFDLSDSKSCYAYFDCSVNYSNLGFGDVTTCKTGLENQFGITDIDDVCGTTTKKAGDPKLYRVIGMFKDIEKTDGTTQDLIKVIREDSIGNLAWDLKGTNDSDMTSSNNWHNATLQTILNGAYYNGGTTAHSYYDVITQSYVFGNTIDFKKSGLNSAVHDKIETVVWNLGGWNNSEIYSNQVYEYERGNSKCTDCTYDTTWPGKIALAYPSDVGYAADFTDCDETLYKYRNCSASDWMTPFFIIGNQLEWLLTPYSGNSDFAWILFNGNLDNDYGFVLGGLGARPVFYLDSELNIESGDGSKSTPLVVR